MKSDIFSGLFCHNTVFCYHLEAHNGITWIVPEQRSEEHLPSIDLVRQIEDLLRDFLCLGEFLQGQLSGSEYSPLFQDEHLAAKAFDIMNDKNLNGAHAKSELVAAIQSIYSDKLSPFLRNDAEEVSAEILQFFNKYGRPGVLGSNGNLHDMVINWLTRSSFETDNYYNNSIFPVSYLAYTIYEIYMRYVNPSAYIAALERNPTKHVRAGNGENPRPHFLISMSLEVVYIKMDGWREQKRVKSIFDLIALFLFYNDSIHVKKCAYCGVSFVSSLDSAIYCSPSCRNRANSKKSYERRKERERQQKLTEGKE